MATRQQKRQAARVIAGALAAQAQPGAGYGSQQIAHATIVGELTRIGVDAGTARVLADRSQRADVSPSTPLSPAMQVAHGMAPSARAMYLVAAATRLAGTQGLARLDQQTTERRYMNQHLKAQQGREQAALRTDAAASAYGPLLGWNARGDERTTPECARADGRNFRADFPPSIGLPGVRHGGNCRCTPGPAHPGARTLPSAPADSESALISTAREGSEMVVELGRRWNALRHPRSPKGLDTGGQFISTSGGARQSGFMDSRDAMAAAHRQAAATGIRQHVSTRPDGMHVVDSSAPSRSHVTFDADGRTNLVKMDSAPGSGYDSASAEPYRIAAQQVAAGSGPRYIVRRNGRLFVETKPPSVPHSRVEMNPETGQTRTVDVTNLSRDTGAGAVELAENKKTPEGTEVTKSGLAYDKKTNSFRPATQAEKDSAGKKGKDDFNSKHPRAAAGSPTGGEFVPVGKARSNDAKAAQGDKGAQEDYKKLGGKDRDTMLKGLDDRRLQGLSKLLYSYKSSDPKVVAARLAIAAELARRGMDVRKHGALGGTGKVSSKPGKAEPAKQPSTKGLTKASGAVILDSKASPAKRAELKAAGWKGRAGDSREALYPPPGVKLASDAEALELATSSASLNRSPDKNWVENSGGLPPGVRKVARKLKELYPQWTLSRCIATAISMSKKWAAKGSAKGARNTAQWETLKVKNAARQLSVEMAVPFINSRSGPKVTRTATTKGPGMAFGPGKKAPPFGKGAGPAAQSGTGTSAPAGTKKPNPFAKGKVPSGGSEGKAPEPSNAPASAKAVRDMVAAYSKVPVEQRDAYRKKVLSKARAAGAMSVIPDAWLRGKPGVPAGAGGDRSKT